MWPPGGGAKSPEGDGPYAYPAGGYFSMKKSNPPPEAEKGNRGTDMGEKGGKLNKKACCFLCWGAGSALQFARRDYIIIML